MQQVEKHGDNQQRQENREGQQPDCENIEIDRDCYYAVFPKDSELADRESVTIDELVSQPFIAPDPEVMGPVADYFERVLHLKSRGISPQYYYEDIPTLAITIEDSGAASMMFGHHRERYGRDIAFVPISDADTSADVVIMIPEKTKLRIGGPWLKNLRRLAGKIREQESFPKISIPLR